VGFLKEGTKSLPFCGYFSFPLLNSITKAEFARLLIEIKKPAFLLVSVHN
jgi:hypothetical protein